MIKELEVTYPEGSDLTIFNAYYQRAQFEEGKKVADDFIDLIYRDNKTGKKQHKIITNPSYTYYLMKNPEDIPDYNKLFIERDKVEPIEVPFRKLTADIAKRTGNEAYYKNAIATRDFDAQNKLHTLPQVFFSDSSIQDHYRFKFAQTYSNNVPKLYKGFFDIEVDGKWAKGDFVEPGECEINCVSYLDTREDKVYTFILRNDNNPLIDKFEQEIRSGSFGFQEIHNFIRDAVGGQDQMDKYHLNDTRFDLRFYDYEIELIKDLFATIHRCSPDFVLGYNSSNFDLPYIMQRIINLGYNPNDVMCDPRWSEKYIKHYVDQRNINELPERGDYTYIAGYPIFIDQMIQYASRRKAKYGSINSFKLDDIGLKEAKVQKLDYHHITNSVTELPWIDFKTFVIYNIMDVIVQDCIELQTQDIEYIFTKCIANNTSYEKGHRQTVYLINRMANDWYKMGYIRGNNVNKWNKKPPKYIGALVGKPLNTSDYAKIKVDGRALWICDNLQDYD